MGSKVQNQAENMPIEQSELVCNRCGEKVRALITDHPGTEGIGACTRCVDQLDASVTRQGGSIPIDLLSRISNDPLVFPTPLRLNADPNYTGKGVTICLIDSSFYPHPDLIQPLNRIACTTDIAAGQSAHEDSWHGTMTSVVCAGSGFLSQGLYKGIASEAQLVLLRVKDENGISGTNIAKAIRWAIANKEAYDIRITNLSVTDDEPTPYKQSAVDQAAEDAVRAGIVVVAAVGNDPTQPVKPPANSPSVIAVGGVDDHNTLGMTNESIYHSTFGVTVDQFLKPELIAPSIWLAAPILPMTTAHREANALYGIVEAEDRHLKSILAKNIENANVPASLLQEESHEAIRAAIKSRLADLKFISADYMHADGTSFAAPIVCAIVAQMLEANPQLTPTAVRNILLTTARKLNHVPSERQGHGVIDARAAVGASLAEKHTMHSDYPSTPVINTLTQKIAFYYHNDSSNSVALVGSFNDWKATMFFKRNGNGIWKAEIPMLPKGTYRYKFLVDSRVWFDDPENLYREPDGFNGLNSRFTIE
jgi:serine protease AprX